MPATSAGISPRGDSISSERTLANWDRTAAWHPEPHRVRAPHPTRPARAGEGRVGGRLLLLQLAFQYLDFGGEGVVYSYQRFDLAHRVQNGCVVSSTKATTDFRQRAQRQGLGKIHCYLTWAHNVGGAPRRQQVAAADVVVASDDALNLLDPHPLKLHGTYQIAQLAFGEFHGDRLAGQLAMGKQAVQCAFEVTSVMGHGAGDIAENLRRHIEPRMMRTRCLHAGGQYFKPQLLAKQADLDRQAAGEARANTFIEAFQLGWRPVCRDHDLAAAVDKRIESVGKFRLAVLALKELQIVDHKNIDAAQGVLEGERGLTPQRGHKAVHEPFGGKVERLTLAQTVDLQRHSLKQVSFAQAHTGMYVERIEHHRIAASRRRHLL